MGGRKSRGHIVQDSSRAALRLIDDPHAWPQNYLPSGHATTVELAPAAGQSVFDIRIGIIADQATLKAAQAYIKDVCR